jgi:hypothetical protein
MKNKAFALTIILLLGIGTIKRVKAQLIYERSEQENFFYSQPDNSTATRYSLYTAGLWQQNGQVDAKKKKENSIKEVDYTSFKVVKEGQRKVQKYRRINAYDANGRVVRKQNFTRGKEKRCYELSYNNDGWFTNYKATIRGHKTFEEKIVYDQNNFVLDYRKFKNGEFKSKWKAQYKDTVIISQVYYKKDSAEVRSNWEYDYYPDNEKKETRYFDKGKLKHRWSYSCDDEGKEIKNKGESKICELKQYNADSTYVVIKRTTGKKGKISKQRYTYDKHNRLILTEYENVKGKITGKHETVYDKYGHVIASYEYGRGKKSDMIRWGQKYEKNEQGHLLASEWIRKGKVKHKTVYIRNDEGLILSSISTVPGKKQKWSSTYKYNEKGLLVEKKNYNKDDELTWIYSISYQYY